MITQAQIDAASAQATKVKSLVAALVADSVVVPPPTSPMPTIERMPLNMARIVALDKQFARMDPRYDRGQFHLCLTAGVISLPFSCTDFTKGGARTPLSHPRYGWLVDGVERASYTTLPGATRGTLVGNLGNEPDGATHKGQIAAYDASGARVPVTPGGESWPVYPFSIDRNGQARNDPNVSRQNSSYTWTHSAVPSNDYAILPKSAFVPITRALPKRETVTPFAGVYDPIKKKLMVNGQPVNIARVALVPNTDQHDPDRHTLCYTKRGVAVTEHLQGYAPKYWAERLPRFPLLDGPRGVCTTPYTLKIMGGRNGKLYILSPWSLAVLDSTGYKRTLFGLRHTSATYHEDVPISVADGIARGVWEVVGTFDPSIGIEDQYPWEAWGLDWDDQSLLLDMTAAPVGGEQPHLPYQLPSGEWVNGPRLFVTDRRGWVWCVQFDGKNRMAPAHMTRPIMGLNDGWGLKTRVREIFVAERGANRIPVFSQDTFAKLRDEVSDPGAVVVGAVPTAPRRYAYKPGHNVTTARTFLCPGPEGLDIMDDWLSWSSLATQDTRRKNLVTGVIEQGLAVPAIDQGKVGAYFLDHAVSDGTFMPRHTIFITTYSNLNHGRPEAFLPGGTPLQWAGNAAGVSRGPGGKWDGGHYSLGVAVFDGRLAASNAGGGIDHFCQADAYDGPAIDYARMDRGYQEYRRRGYQLIWGPNMCDETNVPWPRGQHADMDYWRDTTRYGEVAA